MGRRKNNPELVRELIEGRWTMDQDEFEEKYAKLSSGDMGRVGEAIDNMIDEDPDNGVLYEYYCCHPLGLTRF